MQDYFPDYITRQSPVDLNYKLLNITEKSKYSSIMPWHIEQVKNIILNECKYLSIKKIVDANAHIGVDTILFRLLYPNAEITSIEIDEFTYNQLQKNVNNIKNITNSNAKSIHVLNMDCLDYIYNNDYDLIYFDPPWNDLDYKLKHITELYLSEIPLSTIINNLIKKKCKLIVKLPYNIDLEQFSSNINYDYFNHHNVYTSNDKKKLSYILVFIQ